MPSLQERSHDRFHRQRAVRRLRLLPDPDGVPMSPQDLANQMLESWQRQRLAGIPPRDRILPAHDDFERGIELIRRIMERRK